MKMKSVVVILVLTSVGLVAISFVGRRESYDYLRIHIVANSNDCDDQNVKYTIKNKVVEFLTPYLNSVSSHDKALKIVKEKRGDIISLCREELNILGINDDINVDIVNEYFPTRVYANTTLKSGNYDALMITIGEGEGDNWWCVMYPPLCFVNKFENETQINYKSKIKNWFELKK